LGEIPRVLVSTSNSSQEMKGMLSFRPQSRPMEFIDRTTGIAFKAVIAFD